MTVDDGDEERYSVCIAYQVGPDKVNFYRVADYRPDEADEGDELIPAAPFFDFDNRGEWCKNPDRIFCNDAYYDFPDRDSDVYLFEWRIDPHDRGRLQSRIFDGRNGLPTVDDVREVIDIPSINCREDLVKTLRFGYRLRGIPTKEFYLVYERPEGGYQRFAIKCRRDDFVSRDGTLRLLDSVANTRQSVITAPIVVLDEKKIIQSDVRELQGREIYSGLGRLDEEEGRLLLRPLEYFASDYVKYYLGHCETVAKLTDKERRYEVAKAITEALSRPDQIEEYLGCGCPDHEISKLKKAIALRMKGMGDEVLKLVQDALIEDDRIRDRCVELGKKKYESLFVEDQELLSVIKSEIDASDKKAAEIKADISGLETKRDGLMAEIGEAERRLSEVTDNERRAVRELEDNIALRLGLKATIKATQTINGAGASATLDVGQGSLVECERLDKELVDLLIENLKRLGVSDPLSPRGLQTAATGVACCLFTRLPIAIPEPMASPIAMALSAALYSSTPTRTVVPADYRDVGAVSKILAEPGVHIVEGVIDSANEGVLFAMSRQWESSTVIFSFRSYVSAMLLAKEAWNSVFVPNVAALTWLPFLSRGKTLATAKGNIAMRRPGRKDILDVAEELAGSLSDLGLPSSSFVLPAAIGAAADDECGVEDYEPVVAQHLAIASGATPEASAVLSNWLSNGDGDMWFDEIRRKFGIPNE